MGELYAEFGIRLRSYFFVLWYVISIVIPKAYEPERWAYFSWETETTELQIQPRSSESIKTPWQRNQTNWWVTEKNYKIMPMQGKKNSTNDSREKGVYKNSHNRTMVGVRWSTGPILYAVHPCSGIPVTIRVHIQATHKKSFMVIWL